MGAKKKYLIGSVNFGTNNNFGRQIYEQLKTVKNYDFSKDVRELLCQKYSNNPVFDIAKLKLLKAEWNILTEEALSIAEKKKAIYQKISMKWGVDEANKL